MISERDLFSTINLMIPSTTVDAGNEEQSVVSYDKLQESAHSHCASSRDHDDDVKYESEVRDLLAEEVRKLEIF